MPRVYLFNQRIVAPSGPEVGFDLLLARSRPRRVMAFRNADAAVPEKDRNSIERHTCEKQFDRERIAEAVRMAGGNLCEFKEALQAALPFSLCAPHRGRACPKEISLA